MGKGARDEQCFSDQLIEAGEGGLGARKRQPGRIEIQVRTANKFGVVPHPDPLSPFPPTTRPVGRYPFSGTPETLDLPYLEIAT